MLVMLVVLLMLVYNIIHNLYCMCMYTYIYIYIYRERERYMAINAVSRALARIEKGLGSERKKSRSKMA